MITFATAPPHCLPHSTSPPAKFSLNADTVTAIQEYLSFLKIIDTNVPEDLDIHLVVDNYSTHKHPRVKRWLAVHPRYHVHFTPTYSSWLNQVEIWFNRITQQAIRRGTFRSVKELVAKIDQFVQHYNAHTKPFEWTATADSILGKIKRLCQVISETQH